MTFFYENNNYYLKAQFHNTKSVLKFTSKLARLQAKRQLCISKEKYSKSLNFLVNFFFIFIFLFLIFILTTIKPIYKQLNAFRANCTKESENYNLIIYCGDFVDINIIFLEN